MQHTLVAVFDNRTDAQNAMNELLSSGFTRTDVRLSNADPTGQTDSLTGRSDVQVERSADGDTGFTAGIKNFFSDLFGSDNAEHANRYEGAVTRGHHVLTLVADSLPEVERGADIVERYGPTDIDETASGTPDLATGGISAGAMSMSSNAGIQRSSSMSAQSGSLGNAQAATTPTLDNPGERELFQQRPMSQDRPVGGTYQESMGNSGLTATGGTSLQTSTLRDEPVRNSALEGSQQGGLSAGSVQLDNDRIATHGATPSAAGANPLAGSALGAAAGGASLQGSALEGSIRSDSLQRDTLSGSFSGGSAGLDKQRSGVRIFSRDQRAVSSSQLALDARDDDDSYYRNHFNTTYGATGAAYDDFQPAYRYGDDAARSGRYTNRAWDDIESDLHSDWDSRYAGSGEPSTWEKMKAAVRHGWERMTRDDDDDLYRSHYDSTYASSGTKFEEIKPAYSYGSEMRRSELYRNKPWDDVEGSLRTGWDSRIDGTREFSTTGSDTSEPSAWERVKNAVRHGWDRMTDDNDDDVYYRNHWDTTYGAAGGSYDEYRPAYSYGSEMARNDQYRGRSWDAVETDLRSDWDRRYPGEQSTWEKMKSAVRRGWDRMTDDDDDAYYRNHWNSVYGASGGAYDEYRPAYSYGSEMALNEQYRGRPWNDVETDLRSDWDTRYPGEQSTWEKMKSAVRHGWDRMMR